MQNVLGEVMNELVYGTAAFYSVPTLNDALGFADALTLQLIADQASGTNPTLTARVQHSADGEHWHDRSASPEVDAVTLSPSTVTVALAPDTGAIPCLTFRRVAISLGGTSPSVHVRVLATGREMP